jgi:DNA mismatch repair protein MutS
MSYADDRHETMNKESRDGRYGELVHQYISIRDSHPGTILLFRVGSFYEILFEDADLVSGLLGLKLTERASGGSAGPVPQCGFSHHALDSFLPRLLAHGYRVAVVEEESSEGGSIRERSIVRTLTPGTVTDPKLLREDRPSYLMAIVPRDGTTGLAWTDVAGGEFKAGEFDDEATAAEIQRLDPAEILIPQDCSVSGDILATHVVTTVGSARHAVDGFRQAFPEAPLGDLPAAEAAASVIVDYLRETRTIGDSMPLESPRIADPVEFVRLDAATQRHLELVESVRGGSDGTLLQTLDRTVTPMGKRMLRDWLQRPLLDPAKISVRQRIIAEFMQSEALRADLRVALLVAGDLERLAGRISGKRASTDDLRSLALVGDMLPQLASAVEGAGSSFVRALARPRPALTAYSGRAWTILSPNNTSGVINLDADPELRDAMKALETGAKWQAAYLASSRRLPGLAKLKLEQTATQGLYFEVPVNTPVPTSWIRRGGLKSVERYTTTELDEHAARVAEAEATVAALSAQRLTALRADAATAAMEARDLAKRLAATDTLLALADIAVERGWARPTIDDSGLIEIRGGRHPVLESMLPAFQPNDTRLVANSDKSQIIVLTGPNMAGKSTWMRQTALIVVLAQIGSFVPADEATIGMVDAIYTRIGATDDLAAGRSTFMVEMVETAAVLNSASSRSLVILDEIGRGTSTHDGMAIAWAVIEHLARGPIRPRAIAATHYHELASLHDVYPHIALFRATVDERDDAVTFPHRIEPGAANRSFGIDVARLAGLPAVVLARARQVADAIEPISREMAIVLSRSPGDTPQSMESGTAD